MSPLVPLEEDMKSLYRPLVLAAEPDNGRAQNFRPKRGADPSTLVGRGLPLFASSTESLES
jgi:hypothetical protein